MRLANWGIRAYIPAMPLPYAPVYSDWKAEFEKHISGSELGLVGHSAGAEFILHWLSENPGVNLTNLSLVAPWRDDRGKYGDFSDFDLDVHIPERVRGATTVYSSTDDSEAICAYAAHLAFELEGAAHHQFAAKGHFMLGNTMQTEEFYPLLSELVGD